MGGMWKMGCGRKLKRNDKRDSRRRRRRKKMAKEVRKSKEIEKLGKRIKGGERDRKSR